MGFDLTKLSIAFGQIEEAKRRAGLGGFGAASAALTAADRVSATLDSVNVRGAGAVLGATRDLGAGSLAARVTDAGLGGATGRGMAGAKPSPLAQGLTALAGMPRHSPFPASAGIIKTPSWIEPLSGITKVMANTAAPPGALSGLQDAQRRQAFCTIASLAVGNRDRPVLDSARAVSGVGEVRAIENLNFGWATGAPLYGVAGMAKGSDGFGGPFGAWAEIGKQVHQKFFGWADRLRPYLEGWARIAEEARRYAEWVASQPARPEDDLLAFAAYDALEEMQAARHWVAMDFLRRHLNLRPTPERLEALWIILKRGFERPFDSPPRWLVLDQDEARAYLATAIFRGAERIRRRREMEDNIWGRGNGKELVRPGGGRLIYIEDQPAGAFAGPDLDPAKLVELRMDDRNRILDELLATGTPTDKEIVGLIRDGGYDRADIRKMVGSPQLQAFERKVRRWKSNGNLRKI